MTTAATPAPKHDSVTAYACSEHRRLEALLREASSRVEAGDFRAARKSHAAFQAGIESHIRIEEQVLFPLFETLVGIMGGPTMTLRQEHREVLRTAALMRESLDRGDARAFQAGVTFLQGTLAPHHSREEHVLYPTTDRAITDQERRSVVERLLRE